MPPPFTNSSGATSRTAATIARAARAISARDAFCIAPIAAPAPRSPGGLSPSPAMCALVAHDARRARARARCTTSRASAAASSGVRMASASAPIFTRPRTARSSGPPRCTRARAGAAASIRSSCSVESTISTGAARRRSRLAQRRAVGGRVGEQQVAEAVLARARALSRSVNVIRPRKPPSRARIRSRIARHRTDFYATRIGLPRARRSMSSAFCHIASRSTNANGASRSPTAAS